jgi:hypothetical protein
LHATRPEAADFRRTSQVHAKKGLAKIGDFGEALDRQNQRYFPGLGRICSPPLSAGCLFRDLDSENLDAMDKARGRAPVEAATTGSRAQALPLL